MEWLVGLGYGLGTFFLVVGVVILVLGKFSTNSGDANTSAALQYGISQLGADGLLGWTPAIIAIVIGVFFLSYFMGGGGRKKGY
jgi:hypothetical protein